MNFLGVLLVYGYLEKCMYIGSPGYNVWISLAPFGPLLSKIAQIQGHEHIDFSLTTTFRQRQQEKKVRTWVALLYKNQITRWPRQQLFRIKRSHCYTDATVVMKIITSVFSSQNCRWRLEHYFPLWTKLSPPFLPSSVRDRHSQALIITDRDHDRRRTRRIFWQAFITVSSSVQVLGGDPGKRSGYNRIWISRSGIKISSQDLDQENRKLNKLQGRAWRVSR